MKNWKQATLNPNSTIREALEVIEQAGIQIALVVDKKYQLVGVITDGDIRRGFLFWVKNLGQNYINCQLQP